MFNLEFMTRVTNNLWSFCTVPLPRRRPHITEEPLPTLVITTNSSNYCRNVFGDFFFSSREKFSSGRNTVVIPSLLERVLAFLKLPEGADAAVHGMWTAIRQRSYGPQGLKLNYCSNDCECLAVYRLHLIFFSRNIQNFYQGISTQGAYRFKLSLLMTHVIQLQVTSLSSAYQLPSLCI